MTIQTEFPFDHCESCPKCVLRTETTSITYDSHSNVTERVVKVRCKNASLCMRLEEMHNAKKIEPNNGN